MNTQVSYPGGLGEPGFNLAVNTNAAVMTQLGQLPAGWMLVGPVGPTMSGRYYEVAYRPSSHPTEGRSSLLLPAKGRTSFVVVNYFTFLGNDCQLEKGTPMFDMPAEAIAYWELTR